jgi:hypothetical protein
MLCRTTLSPPIRKYWLGCLGRGGHRRRSSHIRIAAPTQIIRKKTAELGRNGFIGLAGFDMSREARVLDTLPPVDPLCLASALEDETGTARLPLNRINTELNNFQSRPRPNQPNVTLGRGQWQSRNQRSRPNTVLPFLEEAQTGTTSLLDSHMAPHPCSRRGP